MAVVYGTTLYDKNGNILRDNINEILTCLPDMNRGTDSIDFSIEEINMAVRSYINTYIYKVYLLNPDETIREDITILIDEPSFDYSESYQNGQRRSMSFKIEDGGGHFLPNPQDGIWYGSKMMLLFGLLIDNNVYYFPKGIFSVKDIGYLDHKVSLQMIDKFGTIDGTISGFTESKFKINAGTPIEDAIKTLLLLDSGTGIPFDEKTVIFPSKYKEYVTPYTISYDFERNIGELIIELADIISCEVYYDEMGHLVLHSSDDLIDVGMREIQWQYISGEMQFSKSEISLDFSSVYNKVMVVGSNINGYVCDAISENRNPASPTSIGNTPVRFLYISDSNISSDELCQTRADYELQIKTMLSMPISFNSIYIPFLSVGKLVTYTNDDILYKSSGNKLFDDEKIFITSLNMSGNKSTTVQAKNTRELPFYG